MKDEAGPEAQHPKGTSNAGVTSPTPQLLSPETHIISSAQLAKDKSNAGVTSPTFQFPGPETNIISY